MKQQSSARRNALFALCCAGALAAASPVHAQSPVTGPIRIVNAFPPGGPSDIISRLVAEKLQDTLKQTIVVENKPGAGSNIAAEQVARAAPDGQTRAQAGLKDLQVEVLYVAMIPTATPPATRTALAKAFAEALAQLDLFVESVSGREAQDLLASRRERHARIIGSTGMRID